MRTLLNGICWVMLMLLVSCSAEKKITRQAGTKEQVLATINRVNTCWQRAHPEPGRSFWDNAAYHTGNMEAYHLTRDEGFRKYSELWAGENKWMGATADTPATWKYSYGEKPEHVLFD
ncbi:MAG TPA: hypothetical protein VLD19_07530, partial [Chitinophagaceae bacterium]|nr:hypothetical protein [Chitinophagaceae bacterium]